MCQSEAQQLLNSLQLNVIIDCNQKMPYYYNSTTFEYTYQCCNQTDCEIPDVSFFQYMHDRLCFFISFWTNGHTGLMLKNDKIFA